MFRNSPEAFGAPRDGMLPEEFNQAFNAWFERIRPGLNPLQVKDMRENSMREFSAAFFGLVSENAENGELSKEALDKIVEQLFSENYVAALRKAEQKEMSETEIENELPRD